VAPPTKSCSRARQRFRPDLESPQQFPQRHFGGSTRAAQPAGDSRKLNDLFARHEVNIAAKFF
jgi:hypothetical protein